MTVIAFSRAIGPVPINCILSEKHTSEVEITGNPIETGAEVNDHAYVKPKKVILEVADRNAGKRSIPVRIGRAKAARYHWALLGTGLLCAILYVWLTYHSPWQFLFVLTLPLLVRSGQAVQSTPSPELDPALKRMALTSLLFVLLFGIGQLL